MPTEAHVSSQVDRSGYAVIDAAVRLDRIGELCEAIDRLEAADAVRARRGRTYAVRNALELLPEARRVAGLDVVRRIAAEHLPQVAEPRLTRAILFDKNPAANWKVPWHQDVTIAVRERVDVDGFGPWSVKAGVVHVQPPAEILSRMITLRIALDDCDASNGPLLVLPGSHKRGFLSTDAIEAVKAETSPVVCTCRAGGIVLMRPLILHASTAATHPRRRRVLHLEFAGDNLPSGLVWHHA